MIKKNILPIIFFLTLLLWCFASAFPVQPDYDLWARLIAGMSIVENHSVLKHDFYSYTFSNYWYDHEWGASAVIYWFSKLNKLFGISKLEMLSILKSSLMFLIFAITALCVWLRKPKNSPPFQILYFVIAASVSNFVFALTVRCHMFTFLFFTILLTILEAYRIYNKKILLMFIPPLMLIWVNTHGGCLSGYGILLLYIFGEYLNDKEIKPYLITLIVSLAAIFINPYGIGYVKYLFSAGLMQRELISEWCSPFAHSNLLYGLKFKLYAIFMTLIVFFSAKIERFEVKNADKTKIFLLFTTGYLAIAHTKLIPFFIITASIFLFDDVYKVLTKIRIFKMLTNAENKALYAIIILTALTSLQMGKELKYSTIDNKIYPFSAIEFIKTNNINGNIYVDMTYGSYCAYKLYPQNKIFMDGRYEEVYPVNLLEEEKLFETQDDGNTNSVLNYYKTDLVLLRKKIYNINKPKFDISLIKMKKIYEDEYWILFAKKNSIIKNSKVADFDKNAIYSNLFETKITPQLLKETQK